MEPERCDCPLCLQGRQLELWEALELWVSGLMRVLTAVERPLDDRRYWWPVEPRDG